MLLLLFSALSVLMTVELLVEFGEEPERGVVVSICLFSGGLRNQNLIVTGIASLGSRGPFFRFFHDFNLSFTDTQSKD